MPVNAVTFNISNIIGVDVTQNYQTYGSAAAQSSLAYPQSDLANPPFDPGQIVMGGSNIEYVFAQVGTIASVRAFDWVGFLESVSSTFTVNQLTSAIAALGCRIGVTQQTQVASTSTLSNWCWIATRGNNLKGNFDGSVTVNLQGSSTVSTPTMFVGTTAGTLTSVATNGMAVFGVNNIGSTASVVGGVAAAGVVMTWPRVVAM